jgi:ferredoxin
MIIHYGYADASGKYYVSIDAEKCDGCNSCIERCPEKALKIDTVMVDLDDKQGPCLMRLNGKKYSISAPPVIWVKKSLVCKCAKKGQLSLHGKRNNHIH